MHQYQHKDCTYYAGVQTQLLCLQHLSTHLLEDHPLSVELLCSVGCMLDLGRHCKAQGRELPHLSQEGHQLVTVVHLKLAVAVTQLHQLSAGLKAVNARNELHVFARMHSCMCGHVCALCGHVCVYVCVCTCMRVHVFVCVQVCAHVCVYVGVCRCVEEV